MGALFAMLARAEAAVDADLSNKSGSVGIYLLAVDGLVSEFHRASQRDGKALVLRRVMKRWPLNGAIDRQVSAVVRHLDHLGHYPSRYPEAVMHVEPGTGAAITRKLDGGNVEAL